MNSNGLPNEQVAAAKIVALTPRYERPTNDPLLEVAFFAAEGMSPARAKAFIVLARGAGVLDDVQAEIAIDALGLRAA